MLPNGLLTRIKINKFRQHDFTKVQERTGKIRGCNSLYTNTLLFKNILKKNIIVIKFKHLLLKLKKDTLTNKCRVAITYGKKLGYSSILAAVAYA